MIFSIHKNYININESHQSEYFYLEKNIYENIPYGRGPKGPIFNKSPSSQGLNFNKSFNLIF